MLTAQQATEIVNDCLRQVTGVVRNVKSRQRLITLGIESRAKLQEFKSMIVTEVSRQGYRIALSDLAFGQDEVLGTVYDMLTGVTLLARRRFQAGGGGGHGEIARRHTRHFPPVRKRAPGSKWRAKAAKKKAAKKVAKKAKPTVTSKRPIEVRHSFAHRVGWALPGAPTIPRPGRPLGSKLRAKAAKKKAAKKTEKGRPKARTESGIPQGFASAFDPRPTEWSGVTKGNLRTSSGRASVEGAAYSPGALPTSLEEFEVAEGTGWGRGDGVELPPPVQSAVPAAPPLPTKMIECTPQMEIRKVLVQKKSYRVSVFVDQGPASEGADVVRVKVEVPLDLREFMLDVWLDCSSHFQLEDVSDPPHIKVNTDSRVSDELGFTLNVLKGQDESPMYVSAFFRYNGRPSGKITRYLEWANDVLNWKKFSPPKESEGEVVLPNADAAPSVVVETQGIAADIQVEVLRTDLNNGKAFTLICRTLQGMWKGDWNLSMDSKELVNTYMKNFMADKGEARITSLKTAGMDFWDALPKDGTAKGLLWAALLEGAQTMSVISEEPYIPWELIVPYRELRSPREPLGIELQMGRWITGNYQAARQRISLKSGYIICPKISGLTSAAQEVAFLTQQLHPQFNPVDEVVPASFSGVNKGLGAGPRNVIHFICHGRSAALQTLELDNPDTLNSSQVRGLQGFQVAFKDGPLAFLNACEVGGQVPALDGVGGFANSFIELGASAVIAPLWAVQDKVALDVTQTFYPQVLKGERFAEVMKQIRAKAYTEAIDSYAAYCFYGDPMASLA